MTALEPAELGVELLDDPNAEPAQVRASLRNIARANRWFGGAAAVRYGLDQVLRHVNGSARELTLLDVGTGEGDLPRRCVEWGRRRGVVLLPLGLERHGTAARLAREGGLAAIVGDGATLPLRDRGVDVVLLSQVAHHFAPAGIVRLFRECARVARRAVIVSDLRRSQIAAVGFSIASRVLRFDPDTVRDGVTSLRRGFTVESLSALLREAGIAAPVIRRAGARLVAVHRCAR